MSDVKKVKHPVENVDLTFYPEEHVYMDDDGCRYTSGTTFVKEHFPEFDSSATAKRVAARENRLETEILSEWAHTAKEACDYGTLVHEYAEYRIHKIIGSASLSEPASIPRAASEKEVIAFAAVDKAIPMLQASYELWTPESIIFDPVFNLAGTMDIPGMNPKTGALFVGDWKTNKKLENESKYNQQGLKPIAHMSDCNLNHYALQLSLYAWMMVSTGYVPKETPVELAILYLPPFSVDPVWQPLPYLKKEIDDMVANWNVYNARREE